MQDRTHMNLHERTRATFPPSPARAEGRPMRARSNYRTNPSRRLARTNPGSVPSIPRTGGGPTIAPARTTKRTRTADLHERTRLPFRHPRSSRGWPQDGTNEPERPSGCLMQGAQGRGSIPIRITERTRDADWHERTRGTPIPAPSSSAQAEDQRPGRRSARTNPSPPGAAIRAAACPHRSSRTGAGSRCRARPPRPALPARRWCRP
jgi:hypothetical protein